MPRAVDAGRGRASGSGRGAALGGRVAQRMQAGQVDDSDSDEAIESEDDE